MHTVCWSQLRSNIIHPKVVAFVAVEEAAISRDNAEIEHDLYENDVGRQTYVRIESVVHNLLDALYLRQPLPEYPGFFFHLPHLHTKSRLIYTI